MADKRVGDSSHKRQSQENFSNTTPAKKPAIGFSLKSNAMKKTSSTTSKSLKPVTTNKQTQNSIALKLGKDKSKTEPTVLKKSSKLAAVFNEDSDSEPEEIPPEAKMRMKNIGRNTPTSSGPNSFNKGKLGFCDSQRMWEKRQEDIAKKNEQSVKK